MNPDQIMSLIGAYNNDPRSFSDEEAEMIAMLSSQVGMGFRREKKAVSKGLFNMADIGLLGMLPNELEPWSRGESVYGETVGERIGSGVGTVAGLPFAALSGYGLARGAMGLGKKAWGYARGDRGMSEADSLLQLTSGAGRVGRAQARSRWTPTAGGGSPIPLPARANRYPFADFNYGYGRMI
jgi:hypothetical protein